MILNGRLLVILLGAMVLKMCILKMSSNIEIKKRTEQVKEVKLMVKEILLGMFLIMVSPILAPLMLLGTILGLVFG